MRDRLARKLNKYQRAIDQKAKIEYYQRGDGLYVFRNKTSGRLELPKPTAGGMTHVDPQQEWQGDSYYMELVKRNDATVVKCLIDPSVTKAEKAKEKEKLMNEEKEKLMNEEKLILGEKLILDQPDTVTDQGVVEQVVESEDVPINETTPTIESQKDVLISEDPMDGVKIILD